MAKTTTTEGNTTEPAMLVERKDEFGKSDGDADRDVVANAPYYLTICTQNADASSIRATYWLAQGEAP